MAINFIPNDPGAGPSAPALRQQAKRPNRPASKAGFTLTRTSPEGLADPGTPRFLFWQCREAALAAVEAWEASAGAHKKWQGDRKKLPLLQDAGVDLNAFYDRASFSFFHRQIGTTTFYSGASTDVVAHEVGHGLLDAVRPEFFDVNFLEVGAFHEAFGDCMAMLTAFGDAPSRSKLLAATTDLRKRNFVESTAEELSRAIGLAFPGHNASEPRHAFNNFKYQLPQTLPSDGGPGALIDEVHSFGMLFTGCFWELIARLFGAAPTRNEAALLAAARLAGTILIAGAKAAVVTPRFLQSVGRGMVLADQSLNAGANRDHIRAAFAAHDIALGANAMFAASMALPGAAPVGAALAPAVRRDLLQRLGSARGARLAVSAASQFGEPMVNVVHAREIPLGSLDKRLAGVVAIGHEPVMVGASGGRAAVMGALPNAADTRSEVQAFVQSLLAHDDIDLRPPKSRAAAAPTDTAGAPSHVVRSMGGKKVLQRVRFCCRCC
jgi:hypothetical protein